MAGSCLDDLVYALAEHFIISCECGRPCRRRRAAVVPTPDRQAANPPPYSRHPSRNLAYLALTAP